MIQFRPTPKLDKGATLIFVSRGPLSESLSRIASKSTRDQIQNAAKDSGFQGDNGELFPLLLSRRIVLLAGTGKKEEFRLAPFRKAVRNAITSPFLKKTADIEILPHDLGDDVVRTILEGFLLGTYAWKKYLAPDKANPDSAAKKIYLAVPEKRIYRETIAICESTNLTRDLINENADVTDSVYLEKTIRQIVRGRKKVSIQVLNRRDMKAKGLKLHLAVNQGSPKEPKLIIVRYKGAGDKQPYTALVGKGMTYDTGGLNLKPTGHMETMRCDMSGAAAVIGTLKATLALGLKKNVLFAVALAENAIGPDAYKPGDVFTGYAGKSVEIGNTDAEGRLVLADAMSYVIKNYKPARIIDIATLTGACVIALGYDYSGLVCSDDDFARQIIRASNETDDRVWRLPSYPELKDYVKSPIADLKNTGLAQGAAGAITAAEFLRQFTENLPWAHLDIAGTAFAGGKGPLHFSHGATGAGVRVLTEYLRTS
ncbi:MAG: leucyl aminopeptidase [Candidatus Omnitrophota bacterium]|nr:leucyl aminopeptidase [Candidatus Omnitrophota bacterium]MDZ4242276.1 leucyl aminopeptidase [Candidatus Omnitrophota bacterium]